MKRILLPVVAVLSLAAITLAFSHSFHAQDRQKDALAALARADALFEAGKHADAAPEYNKAAEGLPLGDGRDRALLRGLVCMAEAGLHEDLEKLDRGGALAIRLGFITDASTRVDALRLAGLYFAGRDHDYHLHRNRVRRDYALDPTKLPESERLEWTYVNTSGGDLNSARALIALAHEASRAMLLSATPDPIQRERHVALTLELCDLLEVTDRLRGGVRNEMHFFGSDYGIGGATPQPELPGEVDPSDWEDFVDEDPPVQIPARPVAVAAAAAQPSQEPFVRRGYYLQPDYPSLPAIHALMETALRRAADLQDKELQAAVLYRQATLLLNVGLYGDAGLNARLTDWRNGAMAEPAPARDPRPVLRRLLSEHKGSIWDDEARFLLGYAAYYLNDFAAARAEFALLEKDHPKSRYIGEARRLVQVIDFPQLFTSFSTGNSEHALVAPGTPLSVSVYARNVQAVRVSLRPLDLGRVMAGVSGAEHAWADLARLAELPGFEAALGQSVMDQSFTLDAARPHFYQAREALPLYTSLPGVYLLEVSGGPVLERKLVQVADVALQRRRLAQTEQFWVTTQQGRPLPNVILHGGYHENLHVSVPYRDRVRKDPDDPASPLVEVTRFRAERELVSHPLHGQTNAHGLYETALPPHAVRNFWATLDVDGMVYLVNDASGPASIQAPAPWEPRPVQRPAPDLRAFVYTDRPVYRPGDTAYLRLIARLPMGAGKLDGEPVTLRVMARGIEQRRYDLVLNDFGGAVAKFEIPHGSPLGDWDLLVSGTRFGDEQSFRLSVQEYFKKDVRISIDAPAGTLAPGSSPEVPVRFEYLAGGAVQGAEVSYTVDARAVGGKTWRPVAARAATNIDGVVRFALDTARISQDAGGRAVTLTITAEGKGPGGQVSVARATAAISGQGVTVSADWPTGNWHESQNLAVALKVVDAGGTRLRASGSYTIWRITDQTSLRPGDWGNPSIRRVHAQNFDDQARLETIHVQLPRESGRYLIEMSGSAGGEPFTLSHRVLRVGMGDLDSRPFAVVPQHDAFDLTAPCRVLVCQPAPGPVLVSLHADGVETDHNVVNLPATGLHTMAISEAHAPHRQVSVRAVRGGALLAAQYGVAVRPASRLIRTVVRFDKTQYRPGETASAEVFTFRASGEPVEAEVALGVWDSALRDFAPAALDNVNLYDHFFAGTSRFSAADDNLGARTRMAPTRRHSGTVKRWRIHAMPPGSFFYGAQSWTSTHQFSLLALMQDTEKPARSLRRDPVAQDSMNEDWNESPVPNSDPYYGNSAAVGLGGGGGRGGAGGMSHRRARGGGGSARQVSPDRADFRDSAFFAADIRTSSKGVASISFKLPDNLTEWSFEATAADRLAGVGQATGRFKVARDLSLRMVGPRGLTDGDEIELAALVQNLGAAPLAVNCEAALNLEGATAKLELLRSISPTTVHVAPGAATEARLRVKVTGTGTALLRVTASSDDDQDTVVWKYTVAPRGMPVTRTVAFRMEAGKDTLSLSPDLPANAVLDRSSICVQFHGSLLSGVVDALPGLVNYPHGCAEQTTNKFVPLLSTLQLLKANGLDIHQLGKSRMAYDGPAGADRWPLQLTDPAELQKMVDVGFGNLRGYQNHDGGWGWFRLNDSSPHLTATVLAGLCSARTVAGPVGLTLPASEAVVHDILARGAQFLLNAMASARWDAALRARCLYAAAWAVSLLPRDAHQPLRDLLDQRLLATLAALDTNPAKSAAQAGGSAGLAGLVMASHYAGRTRDRDMLARTLASRGVDDGRGNLLFPAGADESARWHDNGLEAHALAVQALSLAMPANPALKRGVDGLLQMKRGADWGNTRATGQAVQALAAYLSANADDNAEVKVGVTLGGTTIGTFERTRDKLLSARTRWDIPATELKGAALGLRRTGKAAVSGSLVVRAFVPVDEKWRGDNNGLRVTRIFQRRTATEREIEVEVRDQHGNVLERRREMKVDYEYSTLNSGDELKVGDVITISIHVAARPGDRYLCIEDARPSCLEPIRGRFEEIRGLLTALGRIDVTKEERDTSTNFYAETVAADGTLSFRHECVVVAGGRFTAMPARAFDMYDEARNGSSDAVALSVK
ncbi:MAG: hypothetical protein KF754_08415 [Planctomycetes bacterium]|nr:hypothetical protein [Planctomycetota bacterium]